MIIRYGMPRSEQEVDSICARKSEAGVAEMGFLVA
jgi:hypothetical protein